MAGLLSLPPTIGKPVPTAPDRHAHSRRHKLKQNNRSLRIAAVAAPVLTLAVVGVGVANAGLATRTVPARTLGDTIATIDVSRAAAARNRVEPVTRSADRMAQVARKGKSKLHKHTRYATTDLKLRTEPREKAKVLTVIDSGAKLVTTGITADGFAQVLTRSGDYRLGDRRVPRRGQARPDARNGIGIGTGVDRHRRRAMSRRQRRERPDLGRGPRLPRPCATRSREITSYGGWDAHGEHASGKAIDIMTSDVGLGHRDRGVPARPRGRAATSTT